MNHAPRTSCWAIALIAALGTIVTGSALAGTESAYKQPPAPIAAALDAPPSPFVLVGPTRETLVQVDYEVYPTIALLARPFHRLGGTRVDPGMHATRRLRQYTGLTIQNVKTGTTQKVDLPPAARIQIPTWSSDGKHLVFMRDTDTGVEMWIASAETGKSRAIAGVKPNDILGNPFRWMPDSRRVLVRMVPASLGAAPVADRVPTGPVVQETAGKQTRMATFQDLLEDAADEDLFDYYAQSQLALVDVETGAVTPIGKPGLYALAEASPNGEYFAVARLERPFSFRVPFENFTRRIEAWRMDGSVVGTIAALPVADEVPQQGVPVGPRNPKWQALQPATLVWAEALDGGDPRAKVPHRDRLMTISMQELAKAGTAKDGATIGRELLRVKHRFSDIAWTARKNQVLVTEWERERRWTTTSFVDLASPAKSWRTVFDRSVNDAYKDPGAPVYERRADGEVVLLQDGDWIYLNGKGATEQGDRPFLDRMNLKTLAKERLFQSDADALESFVAMAPGKDRSTIVTTRQSPTEPPNWHRVELESRARTALTTFPDPAPQLAGIQKKLVKYHRADGVALSGMLYLPAGYTEGTRLPVVVWAYPLEFSDAATAGQVRGSPNSFTRPSGDSPIFFASQGYAVLYDATMPVIGDPETMNDTYIEQVCAAAQAAVDTLDAMGVADRKRVAVGGHSYGAFMTANLLAHTDLFAAGVARSGAYNRSLTPFGFQVERRSYWEATDVYTRISPFTYANKINEPILIVHGEEDNNSGTYPMQSERLFQAIQGNGGTARFVLLPHEAHGYRARESVGTVLAEMIEWCDRWVKNPRTEAAAATETSPPAARAASR